MDIFHVATTTKKRTVGEVDSDQTKMPRIFELGLFRCVWVIVCLASVGHNSRRALHRLGKLDGAACRQHDGNAAVRNCGAFI